MIRATRTILLSSALAIPALAQTGLHMQQYNLLNAFFYNKDSVYTTVSASGSGIPINRVALVNPSTRDWRYQNDTDFKAYAGQIHMRTPLKGAAFYAPGAKVYVTSDGWKSIDTIVDGPSAFIATDAGYVGWNAGRTLSFSEDGRSWAKTADGLGNGQPLMATNGKDVFVLNGNFYVTSTDGGKTVNNDFASLNTDSITGNSFMALRMFDSTLVLATNLGLFESTDPSKKWTARTFPGTVAASKWIWKNRDEILLVTATKTWFTADGGTTWNEKQATFPIGALQYFGDTLYAWPSAFSTDDGSSWTPLFPASTSLSGITSAFAFQGAFGAKGGLKGILNYTWDKGRSFRVEDTIPGAEDIFALRFTKSGGLFASDRNANIFFSPDTGKTWEKRFGNTISTNAIKFSLSDDEKVVVLSRAGQPVVSTDGGKTFSVPVSLGGSHNECVTPAGEIFTAWSLLNGIEIAKITADGQRLARDTIVAANEGAADMVALDDKVGLLVTGNSTAKETRIYRTTDGFASVALYGTIKDDVYGSGRLQALSPDTLILSEDGKAFYHYSYDGGKTWAKAIPGLYPGYAAAYPSLKRAYFFDSKQFIASLNSGGLYLDITGPEAASSLRPPAPRPHGPAAQARFDASGYLILGGSGNTWVDVRLFDHAGRRVLSSPRQGASRPIDARSLPRGIYFLRVNDGARTTTARVLKR